MALPPPKPSIPQSTRRAKPARTDRSSSEVGCLTIYLILAAMPLMLFGTASIGWVIGRAVGGPTGGTIGADIAGLFTIGLMLFLLALRARRSTMPRAGLHLAPRSATIRDRDQEQLD
jgi:hypothetical protein